MEVKIAEKKDYPQGFLSRISELEKEIADLEDTLKSARRLKTLIINELKKVLENIHPGSFFRIKYSVEVPLKAEYRNMGYKIIKVCQVGHLRKRILKN